MLDVVKAFGKANKRGVPHQLSPCRPGDVAACYADSQFAEQLWAGRLRATWPLCAETIGTGKYKPTGLRMNSVHFNTTEDVN